MQNLFDLEHIRAFLANLPLIVEMSGPTIVIEFAIVAVAVAFSYVLSTRLRRLAATVAHLAFPASWRPLAAERLGALAPVLICLLSLWLVVVAASISDISLSAVAAVVRLLAAWTVIRLLSFAFRNAFVSATISLVVWSIAALSILGLLEPLAEYLDQIPLTIGKYHFTALGAIRALFALAVLLWLTTVLFHFLERQIAKTRSLTPSFQVLLVQMLRLLLPLIAIVVALTSVGVDLTALTVVGGAVGIGVGLGLQRTVANLVAGFSLIVSETIKPGDVIKFEESYGWVTSMGARYVSLRTRDGVEHLVPNDYFLEHGVENWSYTDKKLRLHIQVGVAYETDLRQAIALCIEAAKSVKRVLERPEPICLVLGFGENAVNLEIRCWIEDPMNGTTNLKSAVLLAVWDRFREAGIRIPYPQRDVRIIPPQG